MPGWGPHAYRGYTRSSDNKSIRGEELPDWNNQSPEIRKHWDAAADEAIRAYTGLELVGPPVDAEEQA